MRTKKLLLVLSAAALAHAALSAQIRFKNIYQDNMVLQAGAPNTVAGRTDPGSEVTISWKAEGGPERSLKARAGDDGKWSAEIPAMPKRAVLEISASDKSGSARISNVLTGELWMASGQSNMEWSFTKGTAGDDYVRARQADADASNGEIRMFIMPHWLLAHPMDEVGGKWHVVDSETVKDRMLSAIGFLFARDIRNALDTPVGIINNAVGGSCIEAWIPRSAFENSKQKFVLDRFEESLKDAEARRAEYERAYPQWLEKYPTPELQNKNGGTRPRPPLDRMSYNVPCAMYNAMTHGIAPLKPKGVLWYQGESNAARANEYGELAKLLVESWRKRFGTDFWFFYAELAAFTNRQTEPVEGRERWGCIREAQADVLELPKTGVAANSDRDSSPRPLGDIHPPHKDVVAGRFAKLALAEAYGKIPRKDAVAPFYKSHRIEGGKIVVDVEYGDGLKKMDKAEKLTGFAIRGDGNGKWMWADAKISGGRISLSHPDIKKPEAARYGWASNPALSVENKYGLPLRPFSTDRGSQLDYGKK